MNPSGRDFPALVARVVLPFGTGYALGSLYRVINTVIAPELASELNLSAADLGFLTSAAFLAWALSQIPIGIFLDRYGPRRVGAVFLLITAVGAIVFSAGTDTASLAAGRALIGLGASASLMAALKANALSWPTDRLPLANGVTLGMGGVGAIMGTAPVQILTQSMDWRDVFLCLAAASVLCAAWTYFAAPEEQHDQPHEDFGTAIVGALRVFKQPAFLAIAPVAMLMQGCFQAYLALWAGSWLRDVRGIDASEAALVLAIAMLGIIPGTSGAGFVADRLARRGISVARVAAVGGIMFVLVQIAIVCQARLPDALLWAGFILFGMTSALYFSVLARTFPPQLTGRVNSALNLTMFIAAFLLQWLIGVAVTALQRNGIVLADAHVHVFAGIIALQILVWAWFFLSAGRRMFGAS